MAYPKIIAVIGFMATGKSTIGKALAKETGYTFVDTDEAIEQSAGKTIPQIFEENGEEVFRAAETEALRQIIDQAKGEPGLIIACGGGLPMDEENRKLLHDHCYTVQLLCNSETIAERVEAEGETRPMLAEAKDHDDLVKKIDTLKAKRQKAYDSVSDDKSETDILSVEDVVDAILFYAEMAATRSARFADHTV